MHYGGHGRYPLQTSKIRGGDEAEVHWRWKILMIVETMLFGSIIQRMMITTTAKAGSIV
jgi:hypothetical protein